MAALLIPFIFFFRLVQCLRDKFWRSGGIYEFSAGTKSRLNMVDASTLTYERLFVIQPDVLEPLLSYWYVRFPFLLQSQSLKRSMTLCGHAKMLQSRSLKKSMNLCEKRDSLYLVAFLLTNPFLDLVNPDCLSRHVNWNENLKI